jgi:polyisoprenoid-binding protein YceI
MHQGILVGAAMSLAIAAFAPDVHAAEYKIDPEHTFPSFAADHMGLDRWRGKSNSTSGTIVLDKQKGEGGVEFAIDPASIDYGFKMDVALQIQVEAIAVK